MPAFGPRGASPSSPGFTLIEMLVVMAIIAILMSGVPAVMATIPSMRLRAEASQLGETLRLLREQAIERGQPTEMRVDTVERRIHTSIGAEYIFPEVVDAVEVTGDAPPGGTARFRFFPDGSATDGTIRLHHAGRTEVVRVDWLTGRVQRDD